MALLAGCGHDEPSGGDVTSVKSEALTHAQVTAAKTAGLLPTSAQLEWFDSAAPSSTAAPNLWPYDVKHGSVVGVDTGSAVTGGSPPLNIGYPFIKDSTGVHGEVGPFPGGSNYYLATADDGTIVGYGGPASGEASPRGVEIPFFRNTDGTYTMASTWPGAALSNVAQLPEGPLYSGTVDNAGGVGSMATIAHWMFANDGVDTQGVNTMPTVSSDFLQETSPDSVQNPWTPSQPYYLHEDGSRCIQISNSGAYHSLHTDDGPPGVTIMGWVRIPQAACAGAGLRMMYMSSWEAYLGIQCNAAHTAAAVTGAFFQFGGQYSAVAPSAYTIPFDTWTHVAITWDHHIMRTYVNGGQIDHQLQEGTFNPYGSWISVGCWPQDPVFNFIGDIRDVSVTRAVFAADQIQQFMHGHGDYAFGYNMWARYRTNPVDGLPEVSHISIPTVMPFWWSTVVQGAANDGTIVGQGWLADTSMHATIFRPGVSASMTPLELDMASCGITGWTLQAAMAAIPANGSQIVTGFGTHNGVPAGFKFDLGQCSITDLGYVQGHENQAIYPRSMNAAGHIVGYDVAGSAWIYTDESGITDLNDLVDSSARNGYNFRYASKIDDDEEIVGVAQNAARAQRGFLIKLPGMPTPGEIECAGQADGTPCTHGKYCAANNVCFQGVCGGRDPADNVCLRVDGVVQVSADQYRAVFSFQNSSGDTVLPAPNQELVDSVVVTSPTPAPPAWLPVGNHVGAYTPTFSVSQTVSWRVNGQVVTASHAQSTPLSKVAKGSGYGTWIGGDPNGTPPDNGATWVQLQADLGQWAAIPDREPQDGQLAQVPHYTTPYNGTLKGSLSVTPTGALTYSLPIAIPPGVAGMAPNLSLVYNSQGGDGLAGQGWELVGLSMVYRCAQTKVQDGGAVPVTLSPFDGICLDGKHLWEDTQHPGQYTAEIQDFTKISRFPIGTVAPYNEAGIPPGKQTFKVALKNGETRYYGSRTNGQVQLPISDPYFGGTGHPIVAWLLDRVVDQWGNYFDVHYNFDNGNAFGSGDFSSDGIIVTEIDYTGHLGATASDNQPTFNKVTFAYDDRTDIRRVRLGGAATFGSNPAPATNDVSFPRKKRLTKITTNDGATSGGPTLTYELTYKDTDPTHMLPSQLAKIEYCSLPQNPAPPSPAPGKTCMGSLDFGWEGGGYQWVEEKSVADAGGQANTFALPDRIDAADGHLGTQFVDINGDGRLDFVSARPASSATGAATNTVWINNGHGWTANGGLPSVKDPLGQEQPLLLAKLAGTGDLIKSDVTFADMDGDGLGGVPRSPPAIATRRPTA